MHIVGKTEAKVLAGRYAPTIYQEWRSILDLPSPIQLGEKEAAMERLPEAIMEPTLYYGVRCNDTHYYVYYMVYHAFDWSSKKIEWLRKLDSHRHDTEAVLLRIGKNANGMAGKLVDMCTVYHYNFVFEARSDRRVTIEAEGHGIRPYSKYKPRMKYVVYRPHDYSFENMNEWSEDHWEYMRQQLSGVSMPDEQYDSSWESHLHARRKLNRGDIWNRPDRIFEVAKKTGRMNNE